VLAADPPEASGTPGAAPLLVILLLGSLTAGIFFASPLRRRIARRARVDSTAGPTGADAQRPRALGNLRRRLQPVAVLLARGQGILDRMLDAVGERLASRGRQLGGRNVDAQLPPMLGGDIFFDDEPRPRIPPQPEERSLPVARQMPASPWSTGNLSDDRYWPSR
jgi:hypothetical protein